MFKLNRNQKFAIIRDFLESPSSNSGLRNILDELKSHTEKNKFMWTLHGISRGRIIPNWMPIESFTEQFLVEPVLRLLNIKFYRRWKMFVYPIPDNGKQTMMADYYIYNGNKSAAVEVKPIGRVEKGLEQAKLYLNSFQQEEGRLTFSIATDGIDWIVLTKKGGKINTVGEYDIFRTLEQLKTILSG